MATKSVLIIGGSGFVGTHLALRLREKHKVFATYFKRRVSVPGVTFVPFNMAQRDWVKRVVYMARPDVVIYAAGSNDVDWCEANPRETEWIHTGGAANVVGVTEMMQPKFIYLSNSYVFDGLKGNYREDDIILPSTALGKYKVSGENYVRGKSLNHVIVRSSPLFGRGNGYNRSFLDRLRMALDRKQRFEVDSRSLHSFAPVDNLVTLIDRVIDSGIRNKTLHHGGLTKLTLLEFAQAFARRFGYDQSLIIPKGDLEPSHHESRDYSLNSTQIVESLQIKPLLLEQSLDLIEKKLVSGL